VLGMIRRQSMATPVRSVEGDDDMLRTVASCANEAVDALQLPAAKVAHALQKVVQRYGRVLEIGLRDLQQALQDSSHARPLSTGARATVHAPLGEPEPSVPGQLRQTAASRAGGGGA
jgi:hypothetical protein